MVPYFGHHECKQYIRGKPVRFGYKFWCGATRLGYISWFQPYQGKNPNTKHGEYGVSASTVLQFSETITEAHPGQYHFVFDNFFTSTALLDKLSSMGHQATGTVRKGRIDKAPLESDVALKKKKETNSIIELMEKAISSADGMIKVLSLLPHLVLVLIPCVLSIVIPRNWKTRSKFSSQTWSKCITISSEA